MASPEYDNVIAPLLDPPQVLQYSSNHADKSKLTPPALQNWMVSADAPTANLPALPLEE